MPIGPAAARVGDDISVPQHGGPQKQAVRLYCNVSDKAAISLKYRIAYLQIFSKEERYRYAGE